MNHRTILLLLPALLCLAWTPHTFAESIDEQLDELRERFAERQGTLNQLKDDRKVGETMKGYVHALEEGFLDEKLGSGDNRTTVRALLDQENQDRSRLYELLAEKLDEEPEEVAVQNAIRNFKKAEPHHFLRLKDGTWVQKKAIRQRSE